MWQEQTGLRGRNLWLLVTALCVLWLLAILTFIFNLCLIGVMRVNHRGMQSIQFHSTQNEKGETEDVVQFTAEHTDLGTVYSNMGKIGGFKDRPLNVEGSRVLLSTKLSNLAGRKEELILENGRIRLEGVDDFIVLDTATAKQSFSAAMPKFKLGKQIKKVSTEKIVTNKIRSPVDQNLTLDVENMSFRGNEGNILKAKRITITTQNMLSFETSQHGSVRLDSRDGVRLRAASTFALSSSPSMDATVDARRLCVCAASRRVFVVPSNKPCTMPAKLCY